MKKNLKSVTSHALGPPPLSQNCQAFSDPLEHDVLCGRPQVNWINAKVTVICKRCAAEWVANPIPVSIGIFPHSLPEWAFRARPGLWQLCLCPKVAQIAETNLVTA